MDWKDVLSGLAADMPPGDDAPEENDAPVRPAPKCKEKLNIAVEKKGRKGKTATIIYGFECDDNTLLEVAGALKQKLGIGGSARGGEILLQGDVRDRAAAILRTLGYKI